MKSKAATIYAGIGHLFAWVWMIETGYENDHFTVRPHHSEFGIGSFRKTITHRGRARFGKNVPRVQLYRFG